MASLIDDLKQLGSKTVNLANDTIKDAVSTFSNESVKLEQQYRPLYAVRQLYVSRKLPFPHETAFRDIEDALLKERKARLELLALMSKVGANPKDYGLHVYGLNKNDVMRAYPTLKVNPSELSALPAVLIGGAVLASILGLTYFVSLNARKAQEINALQVGADFYMKQGYTHEAALNQARKDIDAATGKKGFFDGFEQGSLYLGIAGVAFVAWKIMSKGDN